MFSSYESAQANIVAKVTNWLASSDFDPLPSETVSMAGTWDKPIVLDDDTPIDLTTDLSPKPAMTTSTRARSKAHRSARLLRHNSVEIIGVRPQPVIPPTKFRRFQKLPKEVQRMVWKTAIQALPKTEAFRFSLSHVTRDKDYAKGLGFDPKDPGITACLNPHPGLKLATKGHRALLGACFQSRREMMEALGGQLLWIWYKNNRGYARRAWVPFDFLRGTLCVRIDPFILTRDEYFDAKDIIDKKNRDSYGSTNMIANVAGLEFAPAIKSLAFELSWNVLSEYGLDGIGKPQLMQRMTVEAVVFVKRFVALQRLGMVDPDILDTAESGAGEIASCFYWESPDDERGPDGLVRRRHIEHVCQSVYRRWRQAAPDQGEEGLDG